MIHYVFDLDDTLIIHKKGVRLNYNNIRTDETLKNYYGIVMANVIFTQMEHLVMLMQ